jgi:hypothetical protein
MTARTATAEMTMNFLFIMLLPEKSKERSVELHVFKETPGAAG